MLDVHERAAFDPEATLPGAQVLDDALTALEGMGRRLKAERDEALKLLRRSLEIREAGIDGPHKSDIRAFLARIGAPEVLTRFDRQRAIERAISAFNPDTAEAVDLLASFSRSLQDRYGEDRAKQVTECIAEVEEALSELERSLADLDPADACSGRIARQMERAQR